MRLQNQTRMRTLVACATSAVAFEHMRTYMHVNTVTKTLALPLDETRMRLRFRTRRLNRPTCHRECKCGSRCYPTVIIPNANASGDPICVAAAFANTVAAAATISSTNGAKARSTGGTNANGQRQYAGALDAARKIYRAQGARGFLQGFWPCILRAFPANAAAWGGYEYTKRLMGADGVESEC